MPPEEFLFGPRPKRKPKTPDERRAATQAGAKDLGNLEFMTQLQPGLERNPIARAGADPNRVTKVPLNLETNTGGSIIGMFAPKGARGISPNLDQALSSRPELLDESAIVIPGHKGDLHQEAVLLHEFAHRGIEKLRQLGVVEGETILEVSQPLISVDEEMFVRLLDIATEQATPDTFKWLRNKRKISSRLAGDIIESDEFQGFLDRITQLQELSAKPLATLEIPK